MTANVPTNIISVGVVDNSSLIAIGTDAAVNNAKSEVEKFIFREYIALSLSLIPLAYGHILSSIVANRFVRTYDQQCSIFSDRTLRTQGQSTVVAFRIEKSVNNMNKNWTRYNNTHDVESRR